MSREVEWLSYSDAAALVAPADRQQEPQHISILANIDAVRESIPIPAKRIPTDHGPPAPMLQWLGRIGSLIFEVECEEKSFVGPPSLLILVPFPPVSSELGDWSRLIELQALPDAFS